MLKELAELMVTTLDLEVAPKDIDPEAPLFGDGLGLDSIDALELSLEISKRYGVEIKAEDERNEQIFASLRALGTYVEQHAKQ
ncbi:MAG: phosphopantetheine-binding protein [Kiloniellales bacterium]|nr:phosphopantetheine-binding protein [Kiloniellales bacterium]